jgi:hypothetical protein
MFIENKDGITPTFIHRLIILKGIQINILTEKKNSK